MATVQTLDAYIAQFPPAVQEICQSVRQTIRSAAPNAQEKISYGLATFYEGENLVHFGVMKRHLGFYPGSDAVVAFADRLSAYSTSKGAIRLPLDRPIPLELIRDITAYRVAAVHAKREAPRP